jgi:hypothetical protein
MVAEQQLESGSADRANLARRCVHNHALLGQCGAGGNETSTVDQADDAEKTGGARRQGRLVTERRDFQSSPLTGVQQGFSLLDRHEDAIDSHCHGSLLGDVT